MPEFKKTTVLDELSWHWCNNSENMTLDKYGIIEMYERVRDMKEEIDSLKEDNKFLELKLSDSEKKIKDLKKEIHNMEVKYNQLWQEA